MSPAVLEAQGGLGQSWLVIDFEAAWAGGEPAPGAMTATIAARPSDGQYRHIVTRSTVGIRSLANVTAQVPTSSTGRLASEASVTRAASPGLTGERQLEELLALDLLDGLFD